MQKPHNARGQEVEGWPISPLLYLFSIRVIRFSALKVFARVARLGSCSRARLEFGLPQPSVSRTIRGPEREVGVGLPTWTTCAVRLTEAGGEYLARAEPMMAFEEANS